MRRIDGVVMSSDSGTYRRYFTRLDLSKRTLGSHAAALHGAPATI
jgi:hypothetical protein